MLFIFSGLPGTGKTTLAGRLARASGSVYLRVDTMEAALRGCSRAIEEVQDSGYAVGYAVAIDILRMGFGVVADSVNPIHRTRAAWRACARAADVEFCDIEIACSDFREHRRRVETRDCDLEGHRPSSWDSVVRREIDLWDDSPRVRIDTAGKSPEASVQDLLVELRAFGFQGLNRSVFSFDPTLPE